MVGRAVAVEPAVKPLRILILGGTGFTGPHQVRYALARGHSLTLFNRGRRPKEWPSHVEELTGDRDTGDLKSLAGREWDVCIDNPTSMPFWVRDAGAVLGGIVVLYAVGIPGMALVLGKTLPEAALLITPFLPGDAIKVGRMIVVFPGNCFSASSSHAAFSGP